MNILVYLVKKQDIEVVENTYSIRQIIEKMNHHKYSVIPVIKKTGEYVSTVSDGDLLRFIHYSNFNKEIAEDKFFADLTINRCYKALSIDADVKELYKLALEQNFIPIVDDRNMFIGIIRRKDIIYDLLKHINNKELIDFIINKK